MSAPRRELATLVAQLGDNEVRVLARIAERLRNGARVYGRMELARDRRAFRTTEAREELEDALVYLACAWLKEQGGES